MKRAKTKSRKEKAGSLQDIPNVGPATEGDLQLLGFHTIESLVGKDPLKMYRDLCRVTGQRQDPCVLDVFLSVVDYASTRKARPWWKFTPARKKMLAARRITL